MKVRIALILILIGLTGLANATQNEMVIVDTLNCVYSLTNSVFYHTQSQEYFYYPNDNILTASFGEHIGGPPGVSRGRAFATFYTQPVPDGYTIHSAELWAYCVSYGDNGNSMVWPHYFSTPYQVVIDHVQFDSWVPSIYGQPSLAYSFAVLQNLNSAGIGWIGTDVTHRYLNDIQNSRVYSQYRIRFNSSNTDVTWGVFDFDEVSYARSTQTWGPWLIITYHKDVSLSDEVSPAVTNLDGRIYPSPAQRVINIEFEDKQSHPVHIRLYDLKGRLVHDYQDVNTQNDPTQLWLPDCPSGIYLLKVDSGGRSQIRKISIIK